MNRLAKYLLVVSLGIVPALSLSAHEPPYGSYSGHGIPAHRHQVREGLRVTSVAYRSPAMLAGLDRGDIILEVDGQDVYTPEQLHRLLHQTGSRGVLKVWDDETRRVRLVRVYPQHGHIGVNVVRVVPRYFN